MRHFFQRLLCSTRLELARCAAVVFTVILVADPAMAATVWSPEEMTRLKAGEAIARVTEAPSPADGDVRGAIDIAAPAASVWAVLYDCAGAPSFMENLKSCSVMEQGPGGSWDVRKHVVQWTVFLPEVQSVFRSEYVKNKSIQFKRAGGDLSFLEGSWQLEPLAGGAKTRINYEARVGFSAMVPGMLVRNALMKDIPHFLSVVRDEVMRRSVVR